MIFSHYGWLFAPTMCNDTFTELWWGIWKVRRIFLTISSPFCVTLELPAKLLLDSERASFLLTFCGRRRSYNTNFCSMNSSLSNLHYPMLGGKMFPLENLPAAPQLHTKPITRSGKHLQVFGLWPLLLEWGDLHQSRQSSPLCQSWGKRSSADNLGCDYFISQSWWMLPEQGNHPAQLRQVAFVGYAGLQGKKTEVGCIWNKAHVKICIITCKKMCHETKYSAVIFYQPLVNQS